MTVTVTSKQARPSLDHSTQPALDDVPHLRDGMRNLVERLLCEYAGAIPAGRVVRVTVESFRRLRRAGFGERILLDLVEQAVLRGLADEIAMASRMAAEEGNPDHHHPDPGQATAR